MLGKLTSRKFFAKRASSSKRQATPDNLAAELEKVAEKLEKESLAEEKEETPAVPEEPPQKLEPYRVSTPKDLWFVPDEMYIVDSTFSRLKNIEILETEFDVKTDPDRSDNNHLVWPNYHTLENKRLKSLLKMKPNGVYLMIDSVQWNGTCEFDWSYLEHHFDNMEESYVDKIAQLITDYPEFYGRTHEMLNDISFTVEVNHNQYRLGNAANSLKNRLMNYFNTYISMCNLNWKFEFLEMHESKALQLFCIDVQLNPCSLFVGLRLLSWDDSYPMIHATSYFGSPLSDILNVGEFKEGMVVLDVNTSCAEFLLELSRTIKCWKIGIVENETQKTTLLKALKSSEELYGTDLSYDQFMIVPPSIEIADLLDLKCVDRVMIRSAKNLNSLGVNAFLSKARHILKRCSPGCIALIMMPAQLTSLDFILMHFTRGIRSKVLIAAEYLELRDQRLLIKIRRE